MIWWHPFSFLLTLLDQRGQSVLYHLLLLLNTAVEESLSARIAYVVELFVIKLSVTRKLNYHI